MKDSHLPREIVEDLNAGRDFREIVEGLHARLQHQVPCNRLAVALYDRATDRLTLHTCKSDGPIVLKEGFSAALKGSSLEEVLRTGEPRIINDLEDYLKTKPASASTAMVLKEGMKSSLSLPLVARGTPIGVLFFSARARSAYTPAHAALTKLVAGHISIALERSMLLDELRTNKEFLETILQTSADAIIVIDMDDRIRQWNRGAERMFGWPSHEMVGRPYDILVPKRLVERGEPARLRELVTRDGFVTGYETEHLTRDGRHVIVNITATAIHDRNGRIVGRSTIVRDMTGLRRMQEELARSQSLAAVGELAASVAHEIKNPLAGISGAIQVIVESIPAGDARREIAAEILAQIHRLDDTVRDLLVFAKPWKPDLQPTDLVDLIERVAGQVRNEPNRKGLLVRRETPASIPLDGDARLLQEVLLNLLHNAADAMPSGGCVRVVGEAMDGHVILRVIDTGAGIPPEQQARLFRPFFTTKTRGTGLGLAISKKIIEGHGGRIDIDSEVGRGTEVRIVLPKEHRHGP